MPNAVDLRLFDPAVPRERPRDVRQGRPTVLYVGALWGEWVDVGLVGAVARNVANVRVRNVGTVGGNLVRLGLPNPVRYDVDVTYDRNGFRNDVDFTQADVVAIGDSFVEAAETARPQTVVAELSRRLGERWTSPKLGKGEDEAAA